MPEPVELRDETVGLGRGEIRGGPGTSSSRPADGPVTMSARLALDVGDGVDLGALGGASCHATVAAASARTCSGLVAPAITLLDHRVAPASHD